MARPARRIIEIVYIEIRNAFILYYSPNYRFYEEMFSRCNGFVFNEFSQFCPESGDKTGGTWDQFLF